jgi:hypothetical protein
MMNNLKSISTSYLLCLVLLLITSCAKEKVPTSTDRDLFTMSKKTDGFVWYKKSDELLEISGGSGHGKPFLRTRYNAVAAKNLDENGKVINGSVFEEGALIVKELYDDETTLGRYAMLYKQSNSPDADAKGWVWGYIDANEKVVVPASGKGGSCITCHSQAENIDYMLMNKFFP